MAAGISSASCGWIGGERGPVDGRTGGQTGSGVRLSTDNGPIDEPSESPIRLLYAEIDILRGLSVLSVAIEVLLG